MDLKSLDRFPFIRELFLRYSNSKFEFVPACSFQRVSAYRHASSAHVERLFSNINSKRDLNICAF